MPGIKALNGTELQQLLMSLFVDKTFEAQALPELGKEAAIVYVNAEHQCIVLSAPVLSTRRNPFNMGDAERDYDEAIEAIKTRTGLVNLDDYHLVIPVIGMGATEKHIVSSYKAPHSLPVIFDSKTSDPQRFLRAPDGRLFSNVVSAVSGAFRSFIPRFVQTNVSGENGLEGLADVNYQSLNTQAYLDPKTCGYHTAMTMEAIADAVIGGRSVSADAILPALNNPVSASLRQMPRLNEEFSPLRTAWYETFIAPVIKKGRTADDYGFLNYFAGLPLEGGAKRFVYFASLSFIMAPLINSLKIPSEFALKALAEGAHYLKDQLLRWSPTSIPVQYLRSAALLLANGVHYGLEGAHLLLRTVTSPVNSFKAAWNTHWSLGLLSAATSAAAYAALAVFALPLVLQAAGTTVLSALPQLASAIGGPISAGLAAGGISLSPFAAASVLVMSGLAIMRGIKGVLNWTIDGFSAKKTINNNSSAVVSSVNNVLNSDSDDEGFSSVDQFAQNSSPGRTFDSPRSSRQNNQDNPVSEKSLSMK